MERPASVLAVLGVIVLVVPLLAGACSAAGNAARGGKGTMEAGISGAPGSGGSSSGGGTSGAIGSTGSGGSTTPGASGSSGGVAQGGGDASLGASLSMGSACTLARMLRPGGSCHFLVGMGNDLDPMDNHDLDSAYTLGTTLDLHYCYLVGLPTMGGWPDWNANGGFVDIMANTAAKHGFTPMFTLYSMASLGDGNFAMTTNDAAMGHYWDGAKLLFQRLGAFGRPAVVHLEPDFWGYAMQHSRDGTARVIVTEHAPDCAGMPDNLIGMAGCLMKLARQYAPKAAIGFHASDWGGTQAQQISFFKAISADAADFIGTDILDRDAGCFEAHTDPLCMRSGTGWYWDETNTTSPNFHEHLAWVKALHDGLGLPVMWWQIPLGAPSTTLGGTTGHYRDNRVHYFFTHVAEFVAAGGIGAAFGTGAANQTDVTTDNNEFKTAVAAYFASPVALQ